MYMSRKRDVRIRANRRGKDHLGRQKSADFQAVDRRSGTDERTKQADEDRG